MSRQKILYVNLKNGGKLVIPSHNITHVETIEKGKACRVYYSDKHIDIQRELDWIIKHLTQDYERSDANEY